MNFELTVPLQIKSLNPSARASLDPRVFRRQQFAKRGLVKAQRQGVHWALKVRFTPALRARIARSERLEITLTRIAPGELDDDNLIGGFKAVRDGVADWLGLNDRDKRLKWLYAQKRGAPKEYAARVLIEPRGVF